MFELFVEIMMNDRPYRDRVMFCTWGGDILERQHTKKQDCEPMTYDTQAECETWAFWYGTKALANAMDKAPFFFAKVPNNSVEKRVTSKGPVKFICESKQRVS